jgi:Trypsin-like peptidase domain
VRLRRAALIRNAIAAALGLGASLGNDCHHSRSPECDACDAVKFLESVTPKPDFPWAIPQDVADECAGRGPLHTDLHKAWEARICPELTALSAVDQWPSFTERFDDEIRGGDLCPHEYTASAGCSCVRSTPDFHPQLDDDGGASSYPGIIGRYDGKPVHESPVETTSGTDATSSDTTSADPTGTGAEAGDPSDTDSSGGEVSSLTTSSDSGDDSTDTGTDPRCPEPSTDLGYWGRAVGLLLPSDYRAGFRPEALKTGPFVGEACGEKVFATDGCTVSLIGPRHVLTSRHCLNGVELSDCAAGAVPFENYVVLFGYDSTPLNAREIAVGGVVACGGNSNRHAPGDEWAVLELVEPMTDRCPLALPPPDRVARLCEPVYALGYPLGHQLFLVGSEREQIPAAWVTTSGPDVRELESGAVAFYTTIDTMDSMSGAPIFAMDGQLIGMNVSGSYLNTLIDANEDTGADACTIEICPPTGCSDGFDHPAAVNLAVISEFLGALVEKE